MDMLRESFKNKRLGRGKTIEQLCDGFSRQVISRFENGGDIKLSVLVKALRRMNCDVIILKR